VATCPDGALAGSMATRARRDGAWAAPANQALAGAMGLDPSLSLAAAARLEEARVNSLRVTPRGLMALAAMTLSGDPEWRQIGTRRLMILLRRALMRTGAVHVFEPDNAVTRRAVTRSLTQLLDQLQRRGAFAGASSAQSFRVAEARANDDDALLTIDIAVAPAAPLRFLNIRLARRGAGLAVSEAV
jgi:phage tail sheath protein FI